MVEVLTRYKVAIVAPTCFYYQVALFRQLASHPRIDLTVYFCSDEALYAKDVVAMYSSDKDWGMANELLDGYESKFLRNFSPSPSYLKWPFGLINLGIWGEIKRVRPDVVVLMSWMNPTWWLAILACLRFGIPLFYMTDANIYRERSNSKLKAWLKNFLLGKILFRVTTSFLCAGTANRYLYRYYGVGDEKLIPFAYSWGYDGLLKVAGELRAERNQIRSKLGIAEKQFVFLYCGRLTKEKGLFDLLEAYSRVRSENTALIFVGDGLLKDSLERHAQKCGLDSVSFLGFQNRQEITRYYAMSDVLVLPSLRETWGIVVNEALCFSLPIVVSDAVGCASDLVLDNHNGFRFPEGDVGALAGCLQMLMGLSSKERAALGARSLEVITKWSTRDLAKALLDNLDYVSSQRRLESTTHSGPSRGGP